jgi:hypothetical protein
MSKSDWVWRAGSLFLTVTFLVGCKSQAEPIRQFFDTVTDIPIVTRETTLPTASNIETHMNPTPSQAKYSFPNQIDPSERYLFYLHGKIIEDQGIPAISPEFGEYEYEEILRILQNHGFVVISEQRSKEVQADVYIERVAKQVNDLIGAGIAPGSITVVGASKGGVLAIYISDLVGNPVVNYVLLGACNPSTIDDLNQTGVTLSGNVLSIYDSADTYASSCEGLFALSEGKGLGLHKELVLQVGTGHGILYKPLVEWVDPTVAWAKQDW